MESEETMFVKTLAVVLVTVALPVVASAALIADLQNPVSYTIEEVNNNGGIQVGDKLFSGFVVTTTKTVTATAPEADAIAVTGVQDTNGDLGLRFNGPWVAAAGQFADSTIKFKVEIVDPELSEGWVISDSSLWLTAIGVSSTTDGGIVSVSQSVYDIDPYPGPVDDDDLIGDNIVHYIDMTDKDLLDGMDFEDAQGDPVALPEVWVVSDVIANGGLATGTGVAHISEFTQTFSQVPEPATAGLLVLGGLLVLARHRRRA